MALIQHFSNDPPAAFELKGRMLTLSVLRVLTSNLRVLCEQLDAKIATAPDLFHNFPVLLDFDGLPSEAQNAFDIARLDRSLRERSLIPVGIRGANEVLTGIATGVGIGVLSAGANPEPSRRKPTQDADGAPPSTNLLVTDPIRSGQQVYAKGGDLIVLATVSPGAEVLADGNIHIYGSLRGRALAGVQGNLDARIFCQHLDAELVSVAGHYRIAEKIQESDRTQPVQVFLNGETLIIEAL
jgi:septum site-determining protein MinC